MPRRFRKNLGAWVATILIVLGIAISGVLELVSDSIPPSIDRWVERILVLSFAAWISYWVIVGVRGFGGAMRWASTAFVLWCLAVLTVEELGLSVASQPYWKLIDRGTGLALQLALLCMFVVWLAYVAFPTSVSRAVVRDFTSGRFVRDLRALVRGGSHTANSAVFVGCAAVAASGWGIVLWFKAPRGRFPGFMNLGQWRHGALVGFFLALLFLAFALRLAREAVDGARMFGLGVPEDQDRP